MKLLQNYFVSLPLKLGLLSVINLCGTPNLVMMLSTKKAKILSCVTDFIGITSTHFAVKFVAIMMSLCPSLECGLISPIKSMPQVTNSHGETMEFNS